MNLIDLANQGDDKEIYRHNMRINSRLPEDQYDEIIAMCKAFSLRGQELEDEIKNVINVDMWMRQFAIMSLLGIGDTYSQGNPHNLNFYVRPSDGKVEPMPWDWDFLFSQSSSAGLWGGRNFAKIPARPVYGRIFHGHLVDWHVGKSEAATMRRCLLPLVGGPLDEALPQLLLPR